MEIYQVLTSLLFVPCLFTLQQPTVRFDTEVPPQKSRMCNLGCLCPDTGQNFALLDCSNRGISSLPSSLEFDDSLTILHLQSNRIVVLSMNTFTRADTIEELNLSLNQIAKIDNFTFVPFRSLSELKISYNLLPDVFDGLLEGLSNLRILDLGHNKIQHVSREVFRSTPNLQELRLQYNPIFDLKDNLFRFLPKLEKLDLEECGLATLPSSLFLGTPRLQWLSLSSNAFEVVPEEALAKAYSLESLDLSGNDFTSLDRGDFRRLSRVTVLYLNNLPRLTRIERGSLSGLSSLKTFSCSYNPKLSYVDEAAFGTPNGTRNAAPHEQLYLRQNALRTMKPPLPKKFWSTLNFVDLADNPWKCDCKLLWMAWLKIETQMNIICDSPAHLSGRPLGTLAASELQCEDKWSMAIYISVVAVAVAIGLVMLATMAVVCSRSPGGGLYMRAKRQFSYAKVKPPVVKHESVDLEWDPSGVDF